MMKDTPQAAGNQLKKLTQIERGDQRVINFEQYAQTIPLPRQLLLISTRGLKVQRVVHGDGYLTRNLLHEIDFIRVIVVRFELSKTQRPQPPLRCGQWDHAARMDALSAERLQKNRERRLGLDIRNDIWILRLQNLSGRRRPHRQFQAHVQVCRFLRQGFEEVETHDLALRIVQDEIQVIEMRYVVQPRGQIVEQLRQIAMLRDGLRHLKKRLRAR